MAALVELVKRWLIEPVPVKGSDAVIPETDRYDQLKFTPGVALLGEYWKSVPEHMGDALATEFNVGLGFTWTTSVKDDPAQLSAIGVIA